MSSILDLSPVIPVVVLDDPRVAPDLALALVAGGIKVIEVTLRTPRALAVIERIAADAPEIVVGAGTVLSRESAVAAQAAGAEFLVSPGTTDELLTAMIDTGLPLLPGCATISEVLQVRERGLKEAKFFPAEASGGVAFLSSVASVVPDVRFCPTGGIRLATAPFYLGLSNVPCVGGTWLTPTDLIANRDWDRITALAAAASLLRD